jgi:ferredoxin
LEIIVNFDICDAHGECVFEAPTIFDLGDNDEHVTVLQPVVGDELRKNAQRAMESCPVSAITLEG